MKRIIAGVVALGLVVVAFVVRNRIDEEERRGPYRLLCATELADACRSVASDDITVQVEPAGATTDRLATLVDGTDPGFDGWLAPGNSAAAVDAAREAQPREPIAARSQTIGRTRVAVVAWRDRLDVLRKACGGALNWRCLGDAAGRVTWKANNGPEAWGPVKVLWADPGTEAGGLAALVAATAGFVGAPSFAPAELEQNDSYQAWLTRLARARVAAPPSIASMLSTGPALADVHIGLEADIAGVVNASARRNDVEVVYLSPVLDVPAVLATSRLEPRATPDELAGALRAAGWVAQIPSGTPLPPPAVVAGLRRLWQETTR